MTKDEQDLTDNLLSAFEAKLSNERTMLENWKCRWYDTLEDMRKLRFERDKLLSESSTLRKDLFDARLERDQLRQLSSEAAGFLVQLPNGEMQKYVKVICSSDAEQIQDLIKKGQKDG